LVDIGGVLKVGEFQATLKTTAVTVTVTGRRVECLSISLEGLAKLGLSVIHLRRASLYNPQSLIQNRCSSARPQTSATRPPIKATNLASHGIFFSQR